MAYRVDYEKLSSTEYPRTVVHDTADNLKEIRRLLEEQQCEAKKNKIRFIITASISSIAAVAAVLALFAPF